MLWNDHLYHLYHLYLVLEWRKEVRVWHVRCLVTVE